MLPTLLWRPSSGRPHPLGRDPNRIFPFARLSMSPDPFHHHSLPCLFAFESTPPILILPILSTLSRSPLVGLLNFILARGIGVRDLWSGRPSLRPPSPPPLPSPLPSPPPPPSSPPGPACDLLALRSVIARSASSTGCLLRQSRHGVPSAATTVERTSDHGGTTCARPAGGLPPRGRPYGADVPSRVSRSSSTPLVSAASTGRSDRASQTSYVPRRGRFPARTRWLRPASRVVRTSPCDRTLATFSSRLGLAGTPLACDRAAASRTDTVRWRLLDIADRRPGALRTRRRVRDLARRRPAQPPSQPVLWLDWLRVDAAAAGDSSGTAGSSGRYAPHRGRRSLPPGSRSGARRSSHDSSSCRRALPLATMDQQPDDQPCRAVAASAFLDARLTTVWGRWPDRQCVVRRSRSGHEHGRTWRPPARQGRCWQQRARDVARGAAAPSALLAGASAAGRRSRR